MATAKTGDTVHVHCTGRLDDGSVFDASEGRDPLAVTLASDEDAIHLDANHPLAGEALTFVLELVAIA